MQRIGVFVCWCGSNIAATVDVEQVSAVLALEPFHMYDVLPITAILPLILRL